MSEPKVDKVEGYGWTGLWSDGEPGWGTSECLHSSNRKGQGASVSDYMRTYGKNSDRYYCKITVEIVRDTLGRPIRRKATP